MGADYNLAKSLFRVLTAVEGEFADDADFAGLAAVDLATLASDDPAVRIAWRMPYRATTKVKIKVTFRDDKGDEVAGTFTVYAFGVVPVCAAEQAIDPDATLRPSFEKLGDLVDGSGTPVEGSSDTPMFLDDLSINAVFGIAFSDIEAGDAVKMFVRMEEV